MLQRREKIIQDSLVDFLRRRDHLVPISGELEAQPDADANGAPRFDLPSP